MTMHRLLMLEIECKGCPGGRKERTVCKHLRRFLTVHTMPAFPILILSGMARVLDGHCTPFPCSPEDERLEEAKARKDARGRRRRCPS